MSKEGKEAPRRLHGNIKTLGWVSFFTDASSEIIYPVIPFFMTVTLGAPASVLGLMEGIAEAVSALIKGASGTLSDRFRRRKPLVVGGYSLSTLAKLSLALSTVWPVAVLSRLFERAGKGVRTPARDALIAEYSHSRQRGRAFGFHRAMDTWGAVLGTVAAFLLILALGERFREIILIALLPAVLAVSLTMRIEERRAASTRKESLLATLLSIPQERGLRRFILVYTIFSLGASSATFLILRAREAGFSFAGALLPYAFANVVYASISERAGKLSDILGRKLLLGMGMLLFCISYGLLFLFDSKPVFFAALVIYGLYLASTEGIGKAFVTDLADERSYGKALGSFHLCSGLATLIASTVAGFLWDKVSPRAPFLQGSLLALAGLILVLVLLRGLPGRASQRGVHR